MSIYTERSIRKYKDELFVIHPIIDAGITGVGYDLHIGYYIKVQSKQIIGKGEVQRPTYPGPISVTLEPNAGLLVITYEHIYLSNRIAATMHLRATYAAQGIFMNSTTTDPNWNGRQVFLLINVSSSDVEISLIDHFSTMVLYDVKDSSNTAPNDTRAILVKYLDIYQGNTSGAFDYVLASNPEKKVYDDKVDRVKSFTKRSPIIVWWHFFLKRFTSNSWLLAIYPLLAGLFLLSLFLIILKPDFGGLVSRETITLLGAIGSFAAPFVAIIIAIVEGRHRNP